MTTRLKMKGFAGVVEIELDQDVTAMAGRDYGRGKDTDRYADLPYLDEIIAQGILAYRTLDGERITIEEKKS